MKIEQFKPAWFQRVMDITVRAFGPICIDAKIEELFGLISDTDWAQRKCQAVANDLDNNPLGAFVAIIDDQLVGFVTTALNHNTLTGRIPDLAVDPTYQRRSIGKQLMKAAFDYFREQGMHYVKIETLSDNEAGSRFYPGVGFSEIARTIHYFMPIEQAKL